MKAEDRIIEKVGKDSGFRVPEGFFEHTYQKISAELPERQAPKPQKLTTWQRLKPYVYLAAMFCGIWCTLKMVNMIGERSQLNNAVSLDNPPALVAKAMQNPEVADFAAPVVTTPAVEIAPEAEEPVTDEQTEEDAMIADPEYIYDDVNLDQLKAELLASADEDPYFE